MHVYEKHNLSWTEMKQGSESVHARKFRLQGRSKYQLIYLKIFYKQYRRWYKLLYLYEKIKCQKKCFIQQLAFLRDL